MNRRGGLLVPFSLVLSALALLLGALLGNSIGRNNSQQGKTGMLDVRQPEQSLPTSSGVAR